MKAPLKFQFILTDADGKVKATSTFENLDQASVVAIQATVSTALNALGASMVPKA